VISLLSADSFISMVKFLEHIRKRKAFGHPVHRRLLIGNCPVAMATPPSNCSGEIDQHPERFSD